MRRPAARRVAIVLVAVAALYAIGSAALYAVMRQTPAVIGRTFMRTPWPVFAALPMKRLWLRARQGTLEVGDAAPGFDLATFDKRSRVDLAALRGKPAVLVFGSYT
jgi:hypothetical protein